MKKYLLLMSLMLTACNFDDITVTNPFAATTDVSSVYTSQFSDVPIPMDMKSDANNTLTTISSSGHKIGKESFSGRVEHNSLGAAMAHNLKNQGWTMLGIAQGENTLQLYQKNARFLIVTIEESMTGSKLVVWVLSKQDGMVQNALNVISSDSGQNFDSFGSESLFQ